MATPSLPDLRSQLDSIDTCLRKYVRMRALLIEVIAFMEDEQEQEHLRAIGERARVQPPSAPGVEREDPFRTAGQAFRPSSNGAVEQPPVRRTNVISNTLSMEA